MIAKPPHREPAASPGPDADWEQFVKKMRDQGGIDLQCYRPEQMRRRLGSLMQRSQAHTFTEYSQVLARDPQRLQEFRDFFTINVSEFFRNADKFEQLRTVILPQLLETRPRLRVWSAACSYGAEPFSVAMILSELTPGTRHLIVGTDIDRTILDRARAGDTFTPADVLHVPEGYKRRFITPSKNHDGLFAVDSTIRSAVTFRAHDLLKDPFERDFDLILCRNVVIYFTDETKRKLFQNFRGSLREGGILFVGGTEMVDHAADIGFKTQLLSFYRKTSEGVPAHVH